MASPSWKDVRKPLGALLPNWPLLAGLVLSAVLLAGLFLTAPPAPPAPVDPLDQRLLIPVDEAATPRDVERRTGDIQSEAQRRANELAQQRRREQMEAERLRREQAARMAADAEALRRARAQLAALRSQPSQVGLDTELTDAMATSADEAQMLETLRLEDVQRRHQSVRAAAVVSSARGIGERAHVLDRPEIMSRVAVRPPAPPRRPAAAVPGSGTAPVADGPLGGPVSQAPPRYAPPRPAPPASAGAGGGSAPDLARGDGAPAARYADADAGATPSAGRFRLGPSADGGDAVGVVVTPDDGAHSRLYEGTLLPAALQTQIQGAYSGPISAQITRHVYSRDRQRVLVPRGTVALGRSGSVTGPFQDRLAVSFHRLIFPDGRWVRLDFTGLSSVGETSLRDQVNRHYVSTFGTAGAIGLLAGLSTAGQESPFMGTMSQQMANLSLQLLSHYMNRRPEVTIRAGHRVNIRLTSDVIVPDYAAWEPR